MNILLISQFFPPHKGGLETATYNTAKFLTEFGHKVIVLTSKTSKNSRAKDKKFNFLIYRFRSYNFPELKILPQISSFGFMPKALIQLKRIVIKEKIHIIHFEGKIFPISFIGAILNVIFLKKPMILTDQGRLKIGLTGIIENVFDTTITKFLSKKFNKIICVSDSLRKRLIHFGIEKDKIVVIPNGVDVRIFKRIKNPEILKPYLSKIDKDKIVLFAGRLDAQKGVEYLIRAIPKVISKYNKVHIIILGNGKLENHLKELVNILKINSKITFIDMIPYHIMPELYSSCDIFCLPSIHEGFPLSIAEALSIGLVIVASNVEGTPEAIQENVNGFLFKPKNIKELSIKLIQALNLKDNEIEMIRKNNIELAKRKYSWEGIINEIENIYVEIIKNIS